MRFAWDFAWARALSVSLEGNGGLYWGGSGGEGEWEDWWQQQFVVKRRDWEGEKGRLRGTLLITCSWFEV